MDIRALEAKYENLYAPVFQILVNHSDIMTRGEDKTKESIEISSVTIDNTLDGADTFSFIVNNAFDIEKGELRSFINQVLVFDAEVEIRLGYGSQLKTLMFGILTSVKVSFPSGGTPQVEVGGFDISYRMMKEKKPRSWNDKKDSEVVNLIAKEYKLETLPNDDDPFLNKKSIEETEQIYPQIVKQEKESDFEFLKRLAERNYYELFVFRNTLYFRKPARESSSIVTLEWNKSLVSFSPEFDIAERVYKVDVLGQDTTQQKVNIVATATIENDEISRILVKELLARILGVNVTKQLISEQVKQPVISEEHAKNMAKAILLKKHEDVFKGSGESIGIPDVLAGTNIELKGLGSKFSQKYYLKKTNHSISNSGYKTTFDVNRVPDEKEIELKSETTNLS
ncbi:phage late control D family protein [Halotia branconii]|uniref:Phage protein D n=1 Tax=Halotia branconii CENA392 TaxID=1539056 RepID=A0AAJ6NWF1_9CYAN|nr:hypothetical protein [Halotia branconii]WGV28000.1 hypothetical protein QI031_11185 [Halotia branconii CENA392]